MSWKTTANKGQGDGYEKAPAGNHPAVLVALVDMGTQENNYQGNVTWQHRAYFVYELVNEQMKTAPGKNHLLAIDLTVSMNEKAKLRKWIEARTGRQIPDGQEYDISQELGQPVLLNVVLNKDGYPKIESVGSVPKGMNVGKPQNTPVAMTLEEFRAGKPVPSFCPWLYGERIEDHIRRAQEITGKGKPAEAPAPANRPAPPSGRPAPPSSSQASPPASNGKMFWLDLGNGQTNDAPLNATEAGHALLSRGLNPETTMACVDGTSEWKPASTFGIDTPY